MEDFYVYVILDPRKYFIPFYVGKGRNKRTSATLSITPRAAKQNPPKVAVIKKIRAAGFEPVVQIWHNNLDEKTAHNVERDLIARFGRRNKRTGILTNLTDGGEGTSGAVVSQERRGILASDQNPGGKSRAKKIFQISTETGEIVNSYPSARAASRSVGVPSSNITLAASPNKSKTKAGGYFWRWKEILDFTGVYVVDVKAHKFLIYQISPVDGSVTEWIKTDLAKAYPNYKSLASIYGIAKDGSRKKLMGHYWRKSGTNDISNGVFTTLTNVQQKFVIYQIDTDRIVQGYRSIADAARSVQTNRGTMHDYVTNEKPYKGFLWVKQSAENGEVFAYDGARPSDTRIFPFGEIPSGWKIGYGFDLADVEKWKHCPTS